MELKQLPIGFIDSGVGGLTVVKEALKQLPNENVLYLGDTARCPYGPRPKEQVIAFTLQMSAFLVQKGIKMLVIACNTATSVALDAVKEKFDIPVVGVIMPGARAAVKASQNGRIGIIGTQGTVKSKAYEKAVHKNDPLITIHALACPKFVPLVESNAYSEPVAKKIVYETLEALQPLTIDTLILGCTHYPLLQETIQNYVGKKITLVDSGAETVSVVANLLDYFDLTANPRKQNKTNHLFYTTGSEKIFHTIATQWLPLTHVPVQHVTLQTEETKKDENR